MTSTIELLPSVRPTDHLCASGWACWGVVDVPDTLCAECVALRDSGDGEWWADQDAYTTPDDLRAQAVEAEHALSEAVAAGDTDAMIAAGRRWHRVAALLSTHGVWIYA